MADSVEERIIADVVTTLQAVTQANGWDVDVNKVRRQSYDMHGLTDYPGCVVVHDGCHYEYRVLDSVNCELRLTLAFGDEYHDDDWPSRLETIKKELSKALLQDPGRGTYASKTNARDTLVTDSFITDNDLEGIRVAQGEVHMTVRFAHDRNDPTDAV